MRPIDYVNITQGTDSNRRFSNGNTLPLVTRPNALAMFAPQTFSDRGVWYYNPCDRSFEGIRLTHQMSPWVGDWSYFCFMPQAEKLYASSFRRWSGFRIEDSVLTPYYLKYDLLRYRTRIELSPTNSGAIIRISADESITVPVFAVLPFEFPSEIFVDTSRNVIEGYTASYTHVPKSGNLKVYFVFAFDCGIYEEMRDEGKNLNGVGVKVEKHRYTVRMATSYISLEQAYRNLERELLNKDFETVKSECEHEWNTLLSRVKIKASDDVMKTFYSCFYRAFIYPNKLYERDENGDAWHVVPESGEIKRGVSYTNNAFWDTYRTTYPFYAIVAPEKMNEIVEGFLNIYDDTGTLPKCLTPSDFNCMPGCLLEAVIADTVAKGLLSRENTERALKAMLVNANTTDKELNGRKCVEEYDRLGYVPYELCSESVNETLDSAYGDYCISVVAEALHDDEVCKKYRKRSGNYKNLFDKNCSFMRAKDRNGNFRKELFDCYAWGGDYTEGSAWQSSLLVPHDYDGLAGLYGGKDAFLSMLDSLFNGQPLYSVGKYGFEIHEMTEMASVDLGQCAISNQPSFSFPYLYAYFDEKQKSRALLRKITKNYFSHRTDGFPGDEDNGSMSCWYMFAIMGLYPITPGKAEYLVTEPLSAKITCNGLSFNKLLKGKKFIAYKELVKGKGE